MLLPSAISYLPIRFTVPDSLVAVSEKCGGAGTLISIRSSGKYSLEGRPPPSEMRSRSPLLAKRPAKSSKAVESTRHAEVLRSSFQWR